MKSYRSLSGGLQQKIQADHEKMNEAFKTMHRLQGTTEAQNIREAFLRKVPKALLVPTGFVDNHVVALYVNNKRRHDSKNKAPQHCVNCNDEIRNPKGLKRNHKIQLYCGQDCHDKYKKILWRSRHNVPTDKFGIVGRPLGSKYERIDNGYSGLQLVKIG